MSMKMETQQKMASWIGDVHNIVFRLGKAGITVDNEDIILVLTMGLPDTYDTLVVSLDSTEPNNFTLDYMIGRLLS
jgi:hypothetical protein